MSDDVRMDFVPDPDLSAVAGATGVATPVGSGRVEEPTESFSPDIEREVEGLLYLGALSSLERIWGHTFEIHTLRAGEELARDQIVGEYENVLGQARALGIATLAAAVKSVDGTPLTRPLTGGKVDLISSIRANFAYFSNYYFPVIERLYGAYEQLEVKQARAFQELEGK